MANENNLGFFNLHEDGQSAIIRLLHTSTKTIETNMVHSVSVAGKWKSIACTGENCPMCSRNVESKERMYVHLYDYTDNTEKVWSRTLTIMPQLEDIEKCWGNLDKVVLKITRRGTDFPKYETMILPPSQYPEYPAGVDQKVAYRCYLTRSNDELNEFYATGVLPAHKKKEYVPKEEYFKNKESSQAQQAPPTVKKALEVNAYNTPVTPQYSLSPNDIPFEIGDDDLPF